MGHSEAIALSFAAGGLLLLSPAGCRSKEEPPAASPSGRQTSTWPARTDGEAYEWYEAQSEEATEHLIRGRHNESIAIRLRLLAFAQARHDETMEALAYAGLATAYQAQGDLAKAERTHLEGLKLVKRIGRQEDVIWHYSTLSIVYRKQTRWDEAEQMLHKALALSVRIGRKDGAAAIFACLGELSEARGDLPKAREYWEEARLGSVEMLMPDLTRQAQASLNRLTKTSTQPATRPSVNPQTMPSCP